MVNRCEVCGIEVRGKQKCCSNKCWYSYYKDKHGGSVYYHYNDPVPKIPMTCPECGVGYSTHQSNSKYCSKKCKGRAGSRRHNVRRSELNAKIKWYADDCRQKDIQKDKHYSNMIRAMVSKFNALPEVKTIDNRYLKQMSKSMDPELHRARRKIHSSRYRRKRRNVKHSFTPTQWVEKVRDTDGVCPMCKKYVGIDKLTMDHIVPLNQVKDGHTYTIDDVEPLCFHCNCVVKGGKNVIKPHSIISML